MREFLIQQFETTGNQIKEVDKKIEKMLSSSDSHDVNRALEVSINAKERLSRIYLNLSREISIQDSKNGQESSNVINNIYTQEEFAQKLTELISKKCIELTHKYLVDSGFIEISKHSTHTNPVVRVLNFETHLESIQSLDVNKVLMVADQYVRHIKKVIDKTYNETDRLRGRLNPYYIVGEPRVYIVSSTDILSTYTIKVTGLHIEFH